MQCVGLDARLVLCQESAEGGSSPFGWRGSPVARNRSCWWSRPGPCARNRQSMLVNLGPVVAGEAEVVFVQVEQ